MIERNPATKAAPAEVLVDGAPLEFPDGLFVLFHKPAGCVCSHDTREGQRIYDLLPPRWLARNPAVDVVTHLNDPSYPVDFRAIARAALASGVAIELNHSKTALARSPDPLTRELVPAVLEVGCRLVVTSDTHPPAQRGRATPSVVGSPGRNPLNRLLYAGFIGNWAYARQDKAPTERLGWGLVLPFLNRQRV